MSYDAKCYELAEAFLAEELADEADIDALAQAIQDTIEHWIASELE